MSGPRVLNVAKCAYGTSQPWPQQLTPHAAGSATFQWFCRSVTLPALAVTELRAWRLQQAEDFLRLGLRPNDDTRVVTRKDGLPMTLDAIYKSWWRFLLDSGLPRIRFHDLRHSHATALLAGGVHPKVASERLGHARVGITLDTYSHVIGTMQDSATSALDSAFAEANGSKAVAIVPFTPKKAP